jgi:hypothetical protein
MPEPSKVPIDNPLLAKVERQLAKLVGLDGGDIDKDDHNGLRPQLRALKRIWSSIMNHWQSRNVAPTVSRRGIRFAAKARKEAFTRNNKILAQKLEDGQAVADDLSPSFHLLGLNGSIFSQPVPSSATKLQESRSNESRSNGGKRKHNGEMIVDELLNTCLVCEELLIFEELVKLQEGRQYSADD